MSADPDLQRPRRRPDVDSADVDGELVLWDPAARNVHRLDPVGSLLWPFLDGETSVDELASDAADVWDISIDEARRSIATLVEQLDAAGLLGDAGAPESAPTHLVDPPSP